MADTIVLKVDLQDAAALASLQNLDALTSKLDGKSINLKMGGAIVKDAQAMNSALTRVDTTLNNFGQKTKVVENYGNAFGNAVKVIKTFDAATGDLTDTTRVVTQDLDKQTKAVQRQTKAVGQAVEAYTRLENRMSAPSRNTSIQNRIDSMLGIGRQTDWSKIIDKFNNPAKYWDMDRVGTSGWAFDQQILKQEAASKAFSASLRDQMQMQVNLEKETQRAAAAANKQATAMQRQTTAMQRQAKAAKQATRQNKLLGDSFGHIIAKMAAWQILGAVISAVVRSITQAVKTIKEVDAELTNIRKVTDMSAKEIEQLGDAAYATASKYGVAANEYLQSVGIFAKAGYKEQSDDLGELAIKTQLVGDVSAEMASKFLLSVDAAYKMEGSISQLSVVLDKANEVENNFATSIEKIAEGMPIVASVANTAHMSIDETMAALGTITAVTQESGTMAARALRALILNIMGDTKTEIEDGVTWTEGEIKTLNDVLWKYAESAMLAAQASGEVVNPMEAIAGLSQAYKEGVLTEAELVDIVTDLGGKLRTNQLLALIKNFDMYVDMLDTMAGAAGSADSEVGTMLSSWDAKTQILSNTWTEFISNFVETDTVKSALDGIITIVDTLNDALKTGSELAAEEAASMQEQFDQDYGEGSRYEYLIANQEHLNALEREELVILEAQKKIDAERIKMQEEAQWDEWQKEHTSWLDPHWSIFGPLIQTNNETASDLYQGMQTAIEEANKAFGNTKNAEAYRNALELIVGEYAEYVSEMKAAQEAGVELTAEQEQQLVAYDALVQALAHGEDGLEAYAFVMKGYYESLGYSEEEAVEKAIEDTERLGKTIDGIPDETKPEVEVTGIDKAIEDIMSLIAAIDKIPVVIPIIPAFGGMGFLGFSGLKSSGLSKGDFGFKSIIPGLASGTRNAKGGPTLVNEGLGPEIISVNGEAFVAGGGEPTVVNLPRGATVLSAEESKPVIDGLKGSVPSIKDSNNSRLNINATPGNTTAGGIGSPEWEQGLRDTLLGNSGSMILPDGALGPLDPSIWDEDDEYSAGSGHGGYGSGGSGGGPSGPDFAALENSLEETLKNLDAQAKLAENEGRFLDAMKIYNKAQDEIGTLLDKYRAAGYAPDSNEVLNLANKGYGYANKEFSERDKLRDELTNALKELNQNVEDANSLEEKKQAVEDAKEALANAERQRTVRIFNPVTGQWEWVADAKDIQAAQEKLQDAEKSLRDEQIKRDIEAIENGKWEELGGIKPGSALAELINSGTEEQKQAIANALGVLSGGVDFSASSDGKSQFNQGNDSHDTIYEFPGGIVISEAQAGNMTVKQLADQLSALAIS